MNDLPPFLASASSPRYRGGISGINSTSPKAGHYTCFPDNFSFAFCFF